MKKIYKYRLKPDCEQIIKMPVSAYFLNVGLDPNFFLALWAVVDDDAPLSNMIFAVYGTGQTLPSDFGRYLGSVTTTSHVWHVFFEGLQRGTEKNET